MILEPIVAGLAVAHINKFVINNASLWQWGCQAEAEDHEDCASYTTSSSSDAVQHLNG